MLILATVPRVFGIGPMVSLNPARVSLCRYRLLISRGKTTGPQTNVSASAVSFTIPSHLFALLRSCPA